ncbi:hypothetical protein [Salininema proteolyticum]|uniref:Uncharacterized protein n=1 Tax=Salininema proteolyticum TaxID=1607685 RepID=A0ABV8TT79_9ACTN
MNSGKNDEIKLIAELSERGYLVYIWYGLMIVVGGDEKLDIGWAGVKPDDSRRFEELAEGLRAQFK